MVDAMEVSSIKIETEYAGEKEYPIFTRPDGKTAQCAIILGRNGTGKSTLARALSVGSIGTDFLDKDGKSLGFDRANVYVFNEDYVIKNFRVYENSSLNPIIVLGRDNEKVAKFEEIKGDIKSCEEEISSLKEEILRRVFRKDFSVQNDGICDFTIGEYVYSRIENELENEKYFNEFNPEDPYGYMNVFEGNRFNIWLYLRWIAQDYSRVWDAVEEEIGDRDEYGGFVWEGEADLYSCDKQLRELMESIQESNGEYEAVGKAELLLGKRQEMAKLISCFIYGIYPNLHIESRYGITSSEERQKFQTLDRKRADLEAQGMSELENIIAKKKKESADSVIKYINQWLYVVFGKNGISLEPDQDFGYRAICKGKEIQPSCLSTGEQNILSLCYFFASLCKGYHVDSLLTKDQIIVLDDPVSSFDDSNKYGVTSLLGYLCQSILSKASKTKLIIMTHDSSFALNMSKMIKAIDGTKLFCWEIQKDSSESLKISKFEDIDRYAGILKSMYDFALQEEESLAAPPPNDVRRVWEAFLSFELGETSIANMESLKKLSGYFSKNQKIEKFMRVFIPQLFINNDSHAKSQVMNGNLYLTPTLEGKPYEDFVKNIVCFMHLVSPRHIAWRMKKTQGENVHDSVAKLDNLVREVLDDPKIVAATSSWQGNQGLRRARHRGGRAPQRIRWQAAGR